MLNEFKPGIQAILRCVLLCLALYGCGKGAFNFDSHNASNSQRESKFSSWELEKQFIDLQNHDYKTRLKAAFQICKAGNTPEAEEILPHLIKLLNHSSNAETRIIISSTLESTFISKQCNEYLYSLAKPDYLEYRLPQRSDFAEPKESYIQRISSLRGTVTTVGEPVS